MKKTEILGVFFNAISREQALQKALLYLESLDKNHIIYTPNPEMVMAAQKDKEFLKILNSADLVIPDGIGVVYASWLNKLKLKQRVAGYDLITSIFENVKKPTTVYLLGSQKGVCEIAKKNIEAKYKNIKVVGFHHGYFKEQEQILILNEIQSLKPHILLVGLGFPKQEKWIYKNRFLPVKISAAIGGSIDVMAGTVKRAPVIFQKLGLEWFYRVLKQPSRIKRVAVFPEFILKTIVSKIKG